MSAPTAAERQAAALERLAAAAEALVRIAGPKRDDRYTARLAEALLRALPEREVKEVR